MFLEENPHTNLTAEELKQRELKHKEEFEKKHKVVNNFLLKYPYKGVDKFTSDFGMFVRKKISPFIRWGSRKFSKHKLVVDSYPELPKNKAYIFASTHGFNEDIESLVSTLDRSAYIIIGSNEQLKYNQDMKAAFLAGLILVDLKDPYSRSLVIPKATRVINNGISVVIFPEGSWNPSENLLVKHLFNGVYKMSCDSQTEVVPTASLKEFNGDTIYLKYGNPIALYKYPEKEALIMFRDQLATLKYELTEKYMRPFVREEWGDDPRLTWMQKQKEEVLRMDWKDEDWDIEYVSYKPKDLVTDEDIIKDLEKVKLTVDNAKVMAPVKVKSLENQKYDYISYLKKTWLDKDNDV